MKLVIEHYGRFILDGIVVVAVMMIVFLWLTDSEGNKGIFAVTGAQINIDATDYTAYTDFKGVYKTESEKKHPRISFTGGRITIGTHTLSNYIKAVDDAGQNLAIKVSSILAPDGTEVVGTYNQNTTEITFSQSGIYTLTVSVLDEGNRMTKTNIKIPVNSY